MSLGAQHQGLGVVRRWQRVQRPGRRAGIKLAPGELDASGAFELAAEPPSPELARSLRPEPGRAPCRRARDSLAIVEARRRLPFTLRRVPSQLFRCAHREAASCSDGSTSAQGEKGDIGLDTQLGAGLLEDRDCTSPVTLGRQGRCHRDGCPRLPFAGRRGVEKRTPVGGRRATSVQGLLPGDEPGVLEGRAKTGAGKELGRSARISALR